MRGALLSAVTLLVLWGEVTAQPTASPPPIEEAIAAAAAAGAPLVVEIGATWCAPCRLFDRDVLPAASVRRALRRVHFVRYDVDTPVGEAAAARFETEGVPWFFVLGADGEVLVRHGGMTGRTPAGRVAWFLELLATAERVAGDPELVARIQDAVTSGTDLVFDHPGTPEASRRLALLAVADQLTRRQLEILVRRHLEAAWTGDELTGAARVAVVAGHFELALSAISRRLRRDADDEVAGFALAELYLHAGARRDAGEIVASLCRAPPLAREPRCHALEVVIERGDRSPIGRLRADARTWLRAVAHGDEVTVVVGDSLGGLPAGELGAALARGLRDAGRRCAFGDGGRLVDVRLTLSAAGGVPLSVAITGRAATEAARCVRARLRAVSLPAVPDGVAPVLAATVVTVVRPGDRRRWPPSPPIAGGAVAFAALRGGAVPSFGAGVHGLVGGWPASDLRLVAAYQLEAGATGDGEATGAARALVGLGLPLQGSAGTLVVSLGGGVSGVGGAGAPVPLAAEVPFEMRLQLVRGRQRGHLWVRTSWIVGDTNRSPVFGSPLFDADEVSLGGAVSTPLGGGRALLGVMIDQQVAGTSATVMFGLPLGRYF